MDNPPDVATIVAGMDSDTESHRKLAAFHLQSLLGDADFADAFIQGDGLPVLRRVVLDDNANTLAYALGSLTKLLELNMGWEGVRSDIIARAVELVVARPLINVLRNALHLLVLVVSKPLDSTRSPDLSGSSQRNVGFRALKPLLRDHEEFLDCLVDKLSSADHALCGNALQLINALLRDSVVNGGEEDWPRFLRRLQELGIIDGVESLMRGDSVKDIAGPILQFQHLYKILLRRWRGVAVEMDRSEHRKALMRIYGTSFPPSMRRRGSSRIEKALQGTQVEESADERAHVWSRLGFDSENPAEDFGDAGFLGLMDFVAYVRRDTDAYQKVLLEQGVQQPRARCPIAKASLRVTTMLFQHLGVEDGDAAADATASAEELEWIVRPLLLRWDRVHGAALTAFLRLWSAAGATIHEFEKIDDLARILITRVVGGLGRKGTVEDVERQMSATTLAMVRKWQLEDLDAVFERGWGEDLRIAREHLHTEAVQFMQEQRIRCLLQGAWFPSISSSNPTSDQSSLPTTTASPPTVVASWRFVRLSPTRRHLHHVSHPAKLETDPAISDMPQRIDVNTISSVVSNVTSTAELPESVVQQPDSNADKDKDKETDPTQPDTRDNAVTPTPTTSTNNTVTQLTIRGTRRGASASTEESVLLELQTIKAVLASEWLDGLLMLLDQQPITADTNKMITMIEGWSLKVRMLNLEWDDVDWADENGAGAQVGQRTVVVPSRGGIDADYWYDMGEN